MNLNLILRLILQPCYRRWLNIAFMKTPCFCIRAMSYVKKVIWGQLSTTCSNSTEVAQCGAFCCSRPHLATDNGVRDGRFN